MHVGHTLAIRVTVASRDDAKKLLTLVRSCTNPKGLLVIDREATVLAPTEKIERTSATLPEVRLIISPALQRPRSQPVGAIKPLQSR